MFGGFLGTMGLSDFPHPSITGVAPNVESRLGPRRHPTGSGVGHPSSRAGSARACQGPQTTRSPMPVSRWRRAGCCLPTSLSVSALRTDQFRGSIPYPHVPYPRFGSGRYRPVRRTRGRGGSLGLPRTALASATPCQSSGAPKSRCGGADATRVGYAFAVRLRASLEQGAACLPARHAIADSRPSGWHPQASSLEGALLGLSQQTPSTEAVEGTTHLASPISNLLAGLLPSRRGGFISLVQGPSSPPSERRSYHGTVPYLRAGHSPMRSSVAREIGPIRRIRLIRPIPRFLSPTPNTLVLFFPPLHGPSRSGWGRLPGRGARHTRRKSRSYNRLWRREIFSRIALSRFALAL